MIHDKHKITLGYKIQAHDMMGKVFLLIKSMKQAKGIPPSSFTLPRYIVIIQYV